MYLKTWKQLASMSFSSLLSNRIDSLSYFFGKAIRFAFFGIFILSLFHFVDSIAGYSKYEVLFFFLTFNLVDVGSQFFLRGIYFLRNEVKKGQFDMVLIKPANPLFLVFTRLIDFLDLLFLIPIIGLLTYVAVLIPGSFSLFSMLGYGAFLMLSTILVLAIHIISSAVTVFTMESDNVIWLYRETMTLGRFPPTILSSGIQFIFTFIIPIIIIVAYPVKALLGELTVQHAILACIVTAFFFMFSLFIWKLSLRHYTSASS